MKKYILVIPAYEPDKKLLDLLEQIEQFDDFRTIIVDDGSKKRSSKDIFEQIRKDKQVILLQHRENRGKGRALKTAFDFIAREKTPAVIITADADGQHSPRDIRRVAIAASENPEALILGGREFSGEIPLRSQIGNTITRGVFQFQTGVKIYDTQTGLRAFSSEILPMVRQIEGERYEFEMNMLLELSKKLAILEIPIETIYIDDNKSSHFRPIADSLAIYKNMLKFALASLASFVVDFLFYAAMILCFAFLPNGLRILLANITARISSAIFNFSVNKKLVFENHASIRKTGAGYLILALAIFVSDTLLIEFGSQAFGINLLVMKIISGVILFVASWFIQKNWIFNERRAR